MPAQPACSHRRPAPLAPATLAVCVALACAHMGPAQAQTAGAPGATAALPEVVISGPRTLPDHEALDTLPMSSDVIDTTRVGADPSRTLGEALSMVTAVVLAARRAAAIAIWWRSGYVVARVIASALVVAPRVDM